MSKGKEGENKSLKKQKNEVKNQHDATFKDVMERKDGTYMGKHLEESFTDLIYGVKINNKEAYISLLLEHKSSPDKYTIFRKMRKKRYQI